MSIIRAGKDRACYGAGKVVFTLNVLLKNSSIWLHPGDVPLLRRGTRRLSSAFTGPNEHCLTTGYSRKAVARNWKNQAERALIP